MKFLHTSDLHIGKKLDGITRLDEQREVLGEIVSIARERGVDAVIISGDVFDTFVPSTDAEAAFYGFAAELSGKKRAVIVISGNHDDEDRLFASGVLALKNGIFFCGRDNAFPKMQVGNVKIIDSGRYFIELSDGKDNIRLGTVPYFSDAPKGEIVDKDEDYGDRAKRIFSEALGSGDECKILVAHFFMLGGVPTSGERAVDLGGARVIAPSAIPEDCKYAALGHLHRRQVVLKARNIIYSGSPMQYSYDEAGTEKSVTIFETDGKEVKNIEIVPIKNGKRLVEISCLGIENADEAVGRYADDYVSLTIRSDRPLALEETKGLKERFPNITQIKLVVTKMTADGRIIGRKHLSDEELFKGYFEARYGAPPEDDVMQTYLEIMSEE